MECPLWLFNDEFDEFSEEHEHGKEFTNCRESVDINDEEDRLLNDDTFTNTKLTTAYMANTSKQAEAETEEGAERMNDEAEAETGLERMAPQSKRGRKRSAVVKRYTRYKMRVQPGEEEENPVNNVNPEIAGESSGRTPATEAVNQQAVNLLQTLILELQKDRNQRQQFEEKLLSNFNQAESTRSKNQLGEIVMEQPPPPQISADHIRTAIPSSNVESVTVDADLIRSLAQQTAVARDQNDTWLTTMKREYKLTTKTRYDIWYDYFRSELIAKGLLRVVESKDECSEKEKFAVRDIIINHISEEYHSKLIKVNDPNELLRRLKSFKGFESNYTSGSLRQKLTNIRYNRKKETVFQFWDRFEDIVTKYNDIPNIPELSEFDVRDAFYHAIVDALGSEIRTLNSLTEERTGQPLSFDQLKSHMLKMEAETGDKQSTPLSAHRARLNGGKERGQEHSKNRRCFECDDFGHISYDCSAPKGWKKCHCCGKISSHRWWNCPHNNGEQNNRLNFKSNKGGEKYGYTRNNRANRFRQNYTNNGNHEYTRGRYYSNSDFAGGRKDTNYGSARGRNCASQYRGRARVKSETDKSGENKITNNSKNYERNYYERNNKATGVTTAKIANTYHAGCGTGSKPTQGKILITFMADSGATDHITDHNVKLLNFNKSHGEVVKGANESEMADLKINGRGDMLVTTTSPNRKNLTLKNVVSAENLSEHLFSLRRCVDANLAVYLDDEVIEIFDKETGEVIISGKYRKPYWLREFELRCDSNEKQDEATIIKRLDNSWNCETHARANVMTRSQTKLQNSTQKADTETSVSEGGNVNTKEKETSVSEGGKGGSTVQQTELVTNAFEFPNVSNYPTNKNTKTNVQNSLNNNQVKPNFDSLIVERKITKIEEIPEIDCIDTANCENALLINRNKILSDDLGFLWHVRLGHPSLKYLLKLQNVDDRLKNVKFNKSILDCEVCILAKLQKKPFNTIRERAQQPMQLIHTDVMGPINPITHPNKKRFVVVFIDDFSRIAMAYAMKSKSETGEYFDLFLKSMRNMLGYDAKVCYLRSDKGTEFLGGEIQNVLKREGIENDTSAPYTPQHNGVAERFNRTISQKVRAYMLDSRLPKSIWDLALSAAVYAYNRTPHKSIDYNIPYSKLSTNYNVRMDQLKRFGCIAYAKIVNPKSKFSAVAVRCVLVGYLRTGYYLLHPESGKFIESKHVRFREKYVYGDIYENGSIKDWSDQETINKNDDLTQWFAISESKNRTDSEEINETEMDETRIETTTVKHRGGPRKRQLESDNVKEDNKPAKIIKTAVKELGCEKYESNREIEIASPKIKDNSFVNLARLLDNTSEVCFENTDLEKDWNGKPEEDELKFAMFASLNEDPISYEEAMKSPNAAKWKEAVNDELNSMIKNKVWKLITKPKCMQNGQKLNVIDSRWIFKRKIEKDNSIKFKARLVIRGFKDKNCYDLKETYAPVSRLMLVRAVLAIINKYELYTCQLDVKTAFLNGRLDEEIYMQIPEGLAVSSYDKQVKVCKLEKALYGLRISPKRWNECFTKAAESIGLISDLHEPCLFTWRDGKNFAILLLYVDDMLIASTDIDKLNEIKIKLGEAFDMSDLGEPKKFLNINIEHDHVHKILKLNQTAYINKILERFGFTNAYSQKTPMVTRQVTNRTRKEQIAEHLDKDNDSCKIHIPFREAVGSLLYLSGSTRPDIAYAVNVLSRRQLEPTEEDATSLKRVFHYLAGTRDLGLRYTGDGTNFEAFSDASFGDCEDRKSTGGYVLRLFGDAIGWRSHKQSWVALSTCEAEYVEMSIACQEIITMSWAFLSILRHSMLPAILWYDNEAAGKCVKKTGEHRLKHMADLRYHHVKQCTEEEKVKLRWISSSAQLADIMTKPLSHIPFLRLRDNLLNWC